MKTLLGTLLVVLTLTNAVRAVEQATAENERVTDGNAVGRRLEELRLKAEDLKMKLEVEGQLRGNASPSLQKMRAELAVLENKIIELGGPPLPATAAAPAAERVVREFHEADFDPMFATGRPTGSVRPSGGVWRTRFNHTAVVEAVEPPLDGPHTVTVLSLDEPGITQSRYALLGEVEYFNVEGKAYLETWNEFPGGGRYFSRTLDDSGPTKAITGTSAKRPFALPFTTGPGKVPTKLTFNVVLPGTGRVSVSNLRLVEYDAPARAPTLEDRMRERREAAGQSAGGAVDPQIAKQSISAALTASDIKRNADGDVIGFTFTQPDPTGTRLMTVREYEAGVGDFPQFLTGRLTWRGVTGPPAKVGYWYDDRQGGRRPSPTSFKTTGTDGSVTFGIPIVDRQTAHLTVAVLCPGPGEFEIELPNSLTPTARLTAWVTGQFWWLLGGLVAVSCLVIVPLHRLARRGRARPVVVGFFGLILAIGVLTVFAAGIALGMGRPALAWGTLLGTALVAIGIPAVVLPQVKRLYARQKCENSARSMLPHNGNFVVILTTRIGDMINMR